MRWSVGRELAVETPTGMREFLFTKGVNIRQFGSAEAAQSAANKANAPSLKAAQPDQGATR
jgi:hypothetical protein